MATVTGLTADRMLQIEAESVVDGDVVGGNLILTRHDGTQINAGSVVGPQGVPGPRGQDLAVLTAVQVRDIGANGQIRAGRQLSLADFTNMGLSAPAGLWNLSDLTDVSGHGRALLNKGGVPFGLGINGAANTAAQFSGLNTQALYISDTGAGDPFRIRTGSFGCWVRTPSQGGGYYIFSKFGSAATVAALAWSVRVENSVIITNLSDGATSTQAFGKTVVADNCWHFIVVTHDGLKQRLYVDANLDAQVAANPMQGVAAPVNIGSYGADGATAAGAAVTGRVDEAFVTADILSPEQIRNLYCARIPHTLTTTPLRMSLNVHRRRRGAALAAGDFPAPPLRLYNFSGGSLGDEGTNNQVLINNNGALNVPGADGSAGNAFAVVQASSQSLSSTDAGLPAGTATRSYGMWFSGPTSSAGYAMFGWGNQAGLTDEYLLINSAGIVTLSGGNGLQGPTLNQAWAFIVVTEDNAALGGIKRKLYINGKMVASSTVLNAVVLGGANHFRIGGACDGSNFATGQYDGVFVCDYALTPEQVQVLYDKSFLAYPPAPKDVGEHIEGMSNTDLLMAFDTLEPQHTVDLLVA